jgi:hypothetical protein
MAAYVIANVVWKDLKGLAEYSRLIPPRLKGMEAASWSVAKRLT